MLLLAVWSASKKRLQPVASWSPLQKGQLCCTDVTNAAADDWTLSRSLLVESFRVVLPFFSRPESSTPGLLVRDSESACSWANSRRFSRLSSDSGPEPTFMSQALCNARGNFSFSPGTELRSTGVRQRGGPYPSLQDILSAW
ncbi:hypothetical protein T11_4293 [Trichinella zimbabwensis]|uniref:Uncharacterized protein n=1 Tax=Trichinella zimbabwensis TaxID=268475 RepID=A0A0V1GZ31_9BILA|nr:hypothetical protein T11_4293 [Trichinella zimbabwensis]